MESGGRDPSRLGTEEEAAKRNTDCVYFLASPSTCEKGNECEFRHSEGARVNPRDCWFWLNGNCLNPKCLFRHPVSLPSAAHTSNKQSIPCYYFQNGGCLKGERCPFMHGVHPGNSPVTQPSNASKRASTALDGCAQHCLTKISADRPVDVSQDSTKIDVKSQTTLGSGRSKNSTVLPSQLSNKACHMSLPDNVACSASDVQTQPQGHHLQPLNEHTDNGRDAEESLRESSPDFDVLVNDECEDTNYFLVDGRGSSSREVNNMVNGLGYHHSSIYNSWAQFARETHTTQCEVSEYDRYHRNDWYRRDYRRYSKKTMERMVMHVKRRLRGEDHSDEIDGSDLRHQILKKRKLKESYISIKSDCNGEPYRKG